MATLTFKDNAGKQRYEAFSDGELAGFIDYRDRDGRLELKHTEVLPAFEGTGVGSFLAKSALEDARAQARKVNPTCSFVAGYVRKHPEFADLT